MIDLQKSDGYSKEDLFFIATQMWEAAAKFGLPAGEIQNDSLFKQLDEVSEYIENERLAHIARGVCADGDRYIEGVMTLTSLTLWADAGFPQVEMGAKLGAALLVSDVTPEALEMVRPPWKAFIISVPDGLLSVTDPDGEGAVPIRRILVFQLDVHANGPWAYIAWPANQTSLWRFGASPKDLLPPLGEDAQFPDMSDLTVTEEDARVSSLIGRLIINTCLSMSSPDFTTEQNGPGHAMWEKDKNPSKMKGKTRQFRIVKPVTIDLREHVAEYIRGDKRKIGVRTLVRGHWRRQPYGPGRQSIKTIWLEPFWRGPEDGAAVVRPHVLKMDVMP